MAIVRRHESSNTRRNYRRQAERFRAWIRMPLAAVRLGDLQAYLETLEGHAPATRALATAALKSLFTFAQETGFLRFNVGKPVKSPSIKNTLAERIMPEADMLCLIGIESNPRNRAMLTLLYGGGLRISEVCVMRTGEGDSSSHKTAGETAVRGNPMFGEAGIETRFAKGNKGGGRKPVPEDVKEIARTMQAVPRVITAQAAERRP